MALLFAPMVRAHRLFNPRLARVSPYDRGNPLAEARRLNRAGYHAAAVILCRIAIERQLRSIVRATPQWNEGKKSGVDAMNRFCLREQIIPHKTYRLCKRVNDKANSAAHGNPVGRLRAWQIVREAAVVLALLEGGAV